MSILSMVLRPSIFNIAGVMRNLNAKAVSSRLTSLDISIQTANANPRGNEPMKNQRLEGSTVDFNKLEHPRGSKHPIFKDSGPKSH